MRGMARVGDRTQGVCCHSSHDGCISIGGTIISGSPDSFGETYTGIARLGDEVLTDCGHIGHIITGDETVFVNGRNMARLGDLVGGVYTATIVSSSTTIFS